MRVAVVQSCYIPWRGFFDLIRSVDRFILYDDVQYSKGSWRNRNQLKMAHALQWITVPVTVSLGQCIDEVKIADSTTRWSRRHADLLRRSLGRAPYFEEAFSLWETVIGHGHEYLSALNAQLIQAICEYLAISTTLEFSRSWSCEGSSTTRLMNLLEQVGATTYLSGPSANSYLDKDQFRSRGIRLEYKSYQYREYPQQWDGFSPNVTILDLLANCGSGARELIVSTTADEVVVP